MWRGRARYFSRYTLSSPKAALASLRAIVNWRAKSSSSCATRIPFPPPPAAALISTGKPISRAASSASSGSERMSVPGTMGTPTSFMVRRAAALSPISRICCGVGPMKVISLRSQISENSAFSARKP